MVSGTHTRTGTVCVRRFLHAQRKRLVIDFWSCPIIIDTSEHWYKKKPGSMLLDCTRIMFVLQSSFSE